MKHKFTDQKVVEIDQHGVKRTVKLHKKVDQCFHRMVSVNLRGAFCCI